MDGVSARPGRPWSFRRASRRLGFPHRARRGDRRRASRRPPGSDAGRTSCETCCAACPSRPSPSVATLVRTIFAQPSAQEVAAQLTRVVEQLEAKFPDVATMLEEAAVDITAFSTFPTAHWRQIWSKQPTGAAQPRDQAQDRRGGYLPEPRLSTSSHRRCPARAAWRMGRGQALHRGRVDVPDPRASL